MNDKLMFMLVLMLCVPAVSAAETFTPIFCNDYEFTCCGGKVYSTESYPISDEIFWECPDFAYKCRILSSSYEEYWVGSENCLLVDYTIYERLECNDEQKYKVEMQPDDKVFLRNGWSNADGVVQIKIIKPQLGYCGRSGSSSEESTCGIQVSGADGCKFSPINGIVYTSTSSLTGKEMTNSYVVPMGDCVLAFQSGDRHICGYKEESCNSDFDCHGHTYGPSECIGRTLQTYGCRNYGAPINGGDRSPFDSGWGQDKQQPISGNADFGSRCEIVSSQPVQCCGDTDCGSNYFCDKSTFTCKENVECRIDSDCGVSVQCDSYSRMLKKPICQTGKCAYEQKNVECCSNNNCQNGGYCSEYICVGGAASSVEVPKSGNVDSNQGGNISSTENPSSGGLIIILIIIFVILAVVGGFIYKNGGVKIKIKSEKENHDTNQPKKKHCVECGHPLRHDAEFCTNCGNRLTAK